MFKSFYLSIFIIFSIGAIANNKADSLKVLLTKIDRNQKPIILNELAELDLEEDDSLVSSYLDESITISEKFGLKSEKAKAVYLYGELAYYKSNYQQAIEKYSQANNLYKEQSDTLNQIECLKSEGLCHYYLQELEVALQKYFDAYKLAEKVGAKKQQALLCSNLAMVYSRVENYDEAISYHIKSLKIKEEENMISQMAVNYNGLGVVYFNEAKYDSSKYYYQKALRIFQENNEKLREAIVFNNLANIHVNEKDSLQKALKYYQKAEAIFKELGDVRSQSYTLEGLGGVYRELGNFSKAIELYKKGLALVTGNLTDYYLMRLYYADLAITFEKIGRYKTALEYERLANEYDDSLLNEQRVKEIASLEKIYETEKKEAEIEKLKIEQQLNKEQLKRSKYVKILGSISLALLLTALFYMTDRFYERKRASEILEEKNKLISQREDELRQLNAAKNKFFSIIAHDLKSPFHAIMGYSQLLFKNYKEYDAKERIGFAGNINRSANVVYGLLQNLLEWSRSQTDRISFNPVKVRFAFIFDNVTNLLETLSKEKKISILTDFDQFTELYADPNMLETCLRNLISNAIKFSNYGGEVHVSFSERWDEYLISVSDFGVGISEEDVNCLFKIDSKVKHKGTNNEDGSGIGLILCKEFIDKHKGKIWVESTKGEGSSFYISLPKPQVIS